MNTVTGLCNRLQVCVPLSVHLTISSCTGIYGGIYTYITFIISHLKRYQTNLPNINLYDTLLYLHTLTHTTTDPRPRRLLRFHRARRADRGPRSPRDDAGLPDLAAVLRRHAGALLVPRSRSRGALLPISEACQGETAAERERSQSPQGRALLGYPC